MSERFASRFDEMLALVQKQIVVFEDGGVVPKFIDALIGEGVSVPVLDFRGDTRVPIA